MIGLGILAGESRDQYVDRLESELAEARERIDELESELEISEQRQDASVSAGSDDADELAFLREQLAELAQQIRSPSAPTKKSQVKRLIEGWLRREPWENRTWK